MAELVPTDDIKRMLIAIAKAYEYRKIYSTDRYS